MSVKRIVDTSFWKDDVVAEKYSAEDRYFFLYLLTNPNSKQCGIYHLPLRTIAFEMGHTKESVASILKRFEKNFKNIVYNRDTQEIAILNFFKYSIVKGGKPVEDCITKELQEVKDKTLVAKVYTHLKSFFDEQEYNNKTNFINIKKILENYLKNNNLMNNEIENDNENEDDNDNDNDNENERIVPRIVPRIVNSPNNKLPYKEIVDYLNSKTGSNYKATTKKTQKLINARFNEGFNLKDFYTVIDKKTLDWLRDEKMSKFLRPETLFGNKFEGYLNQKKRQLTTGDLNYSMEDFNDFIDFNSFPTYNKGDENKK